MGADGRIKKNMVLGLMFGPGYLQLGIRILLHCVIWRSGGIIKYGNVPHFSEGKNVHD